MNNKEVAHLWAHKARESARGSHFFFNGDTIYSYGAHFPIARHVKNKQGQPAILFTTLRRSQSTARHVSYTRSAIQPGVPVFYVLDPERRPGELEGVISQKEGKENLLSYTEDAVNYVQESRKPRKQAHVKARLIGYAQDELRKAQEFADFFGLDYTAPADALKLADEWQVEIEAEHKRQALKAKRGAAKALREAREKIAAFIAGENVTLPFIKQTYARIEGDGLATSKGARVPLEHVKRVWPVVKRTIDKGGEFHANGKALHVGNYQIQEIKSDGTLIAGCHRFEKAEVLRIGALLEQ